MAEKNEKGTILIADDKEENRELLKIMLLSQGYKVYEASDGEEGLAMIKEKKPDVVLLDIEMPKMNGLEVCKRMIEDEELVKIPVIFVTSAEEFKEEQKLVLGLDTGALDYILRPISQDVLLARVRVGIRLREAEKKLEEKHHELEQRYKELKEFHDLAVGRELKMIELEKKVKELEKRLETKG
jgi:adenylate cyclase